MEQDIRLSYGVRFPIAGLYVGRDGWKDLEPLLVQDGEQEFLRYFSHFTAKDLLHRARRSRTYHEKLGATLEALAKAVLHAQDEAVYRIKQANGKANAPPDPHSARF